MQYTRYNIPISAHKVPDIRTLNAMRLIASTPDESSPLRTSLTHMLFDAVWLERKGSIVIFCSLLYVISKLY